MSGNRFVLGTDIGGTIAVECRDLLGTTHLAPLPRMKCNACLPTC